MSLRYRIAVTIFMLELAMMGLVLWQSLALFLEESRRELAATDQVTINVLAGLAHTALITEGHAALQPYLEHVVREPHIRAVYLADETFRVVAATETGRIGQPLGPLLAHGDHYWRQATIGDAAGRLGTLVVEFTQGAFRDAYRQALRRGAVLAAAGMLVIAIVGLAMGHLLTRRLGRLVEVAGELGAGRLSVRARLRGRDEVARLGRVFDAMAGHVEEMRGSLEALNADLEQRVNARTRELRQTVREMEAFSYSVSHDLRSPLRAIDGYCQVLAEDYAQDLTPAARDYLERVRAASRRLGGRIDDLLLLTRLSREPMRRETVDLAVLAREVLLLLPESLGGSSPTTVVPETLPAWGDPRLLRILLEQLLGNAWKYTRERAEPRLELGVSLQGGERVYFVRDNGIGFDMAEAGTLFEPFRRLHGGAYPGTGIGLAIARRVIERHGGRIWAEGEPACGARFCFLLPITDSATGDDAAGPPPD